MVPLVVPRTDRGAGQGPWEWGTRSARPAASAVPHSRPRGQKDRCPGDAARTGKSPPPSRPGDRLLRTGCCSRPADTAARPPRPSQGPAGPRNLPLPSAREEDPPHTWNSRGPLFPTRTRGGVFALKANDRRLGRKKRSPVGWDQAPSGQRQKGLGARRRAPGHPDASGLSARVSRSGFAFPSSRGPRRLLRGLGSSLHAGSLTGAESQVPFVRLPKGPCSWPLPGSRSVCLPLPAVSTLR